MKVSIILTAYIQQKWQAHMTMAAIANITRYTNPEDYELIVMSDSEKFAIRDDQHVFKIDRYIKTENMSYTQSMNKGAQLAAYDTLVFIQNDVFVWEKWLENMYWYIEHGYGQCVVPDQVPRSRNEVLEIQKKSMQEAMYGSRDEGCLMITKEAFNKVGGWNEDLTLLCGRDFWARLRNANIIQIDTCKTMITHIMGATNVFRLQNKQEEYDSMMQHDGDILNT